MAQNVLLQDIKSVLCVYMYVCVINKYNAHISHTHTHTKLLSQVESFIQNAWDQKYFRFGPFGFLVLELWLMSRMLSLYLLIYLIRHLRAESNLHFIYTLHTQPGGNFI